MLNEIDIASLLFGGASVLDAQSGFTGRFVSEGLRLSKSHAFRCFGVHQLRHTGRAPCGVQALDHHGFEVSALAQMQNVAKLDFLGRLGGDVVDFDPALLNFFAGQGAGFKKACGPKPFVNSHGKETPSCVMKSSTLQAPSSLTRIVFKQ